ncbi:hypothetical protein PR202_ga10137 [Eleusine coracana subsp. coracana]|uniref:DNA-directed RNA polymerase III subunit RPC3 n=1 Tax=Eleusine coracana subsp. coracana TaxID=191504 RepID=A0AAV5C606_ELECO|nr:hypothetical protein PR202_ga10137 [Eleusine coracana subsp. coracana]
MKNISLAQTIEEVLSLEQKVVYTAVLSDAERFSEIPYFMVDSSNANDSHHQSVAGSKLFCVFEGKNHLLIVLTVVFQRKHESLEVDEENTIIAENEVLWRANFEKLIFCLKKKFCAERKKAKLKLDTHFIWEAFLEANVTNKDKKSDLNKLVETCRNDEIESLVKKKYGQEAYVIFRLLVKHGCPIETDQITDMTILDKQNVHRTLYKLWQDEYIDLERVSGGTGNIYYYVWRIKSTLQEKFIDHLYHAALNLRQMVNNMVELQLEVSTEGSQT